MCSSMFSKVLLQFQTRQERHEESMIFEKGHVLIQSLPVILEFSCLKLVNFPRRSTLLFQRSSISVVEFLKQITRSMMMK